MDRELAIAYVLLAVVAGIVGRKQRFGFWGFFSYSLLITPFAVLVFLYFASPRKA